MTARPAVCCPDRIAAFLHESLPPPERAAFEEHLDGCQACREALDRAVAAPQDWSELRESLAAGNEGSSPWNSGGAERDDREFDRYRKLLGPTDDPRMLGRIGGYEIVGVLGRGGMGVVFKGLDPSLNRYVAIKVLAPAISAFGASAQRFLREAQSAAAVAHEHVVAIHGIAQWQETPYLVMEYVRGESLQKRIAKRGSLQIQELLRIGMQVASGMAAAHAQGLIHRDIKPANILLETDIDRARISDFGLARAVDDIRLTRSDMLLGTPQYMSPEQARDEPLDFRTDLFSLGVVLYEASTGRAPFQAATSYGALRKITDHMPAPVRQLNPELPEWFERIVARLMAKRPGERYQTAAETAALLQQCLAHVEQPRLVPLPASLREGKRRIVFFSRRVVMSAAAVATLVTGTWLLTSYLNPAGPTAPGERADKSAANAAKEKHSVSVLKVADVSDMKMDLQFDLNPVSGQGTGAGAADGSGSGGGGRFTKPNLGIALKIESLKPKEGAIVELSSKVKAIDDLGRTVEPPSVGPNKVHFQEFEASLPGAHAIYLCRQDKDAKSLKLLEGEVLVSPGRVLVAEFAGPAFDAGNPQVRGGETFGLISLTRRDDGIEIATTCPATKARAAARTPQEALQASLASRGCYSAEIVDDAGEILRASAGSSSGGGGSGKVGGQGNVQRRTESVTQTFHFAALPKGREIKSVRIRLTERTGPAKAVPFAIEDVPLR